MTPKGALAHLARPGTEIAVRVTPGARREAIAEDGRGLSVHVTSPPAGGKANLAVQKLLARALGVAKTRLVLTRGATSRDKVFRLD